MEVYRNKKREGGAMIGFHIVPILAILCLMNEREFFKLSLENF
jgi:hypothetical protein